MEEPLRSDPFVPWGPINSGFSNSTDFNRTRMTVDRKDAFVYDCALISFVSGVESLGAQKDQEKRFSYYLQ